MPEMKTQPVYINMSPYQNNPLPAIVFVVTVYNNENYITECLKSIASQNYSNYRCIVVDDASVDNTWSIVEEFVKRFPEKFSGLKNSIRKWKMENFINALSFCDNDDVIIEVDGDDYLIHDNVAKDLAELHCRFDVVWTQHMIDYSLCPDWHTWYSTPIPDNWTRVEPWRPSLWTKNMHPGHLRTFKKRYFDLIREGDFCWNGEYLKASADAAYFTALLELTPSYLRYFYARPCLCYRITEGSDTLNELLSENLPDIERQTSVSDYIKSLPPYDPIKIYSIYFSVMDHDCNDELFNSISWLHQALPFVKISIGINSSEQIDIPSACGISTIYYLDKIGNNSFFKMKKDVLMNGDVKKLLIINYLLRNTIFDHLIVVSNPQIVYKLKNCNFSITKWVNEKGVVYLQKSPEVLSSIHKCLRDESFALKNNPYLQKIVQE